MKSYAEKATASASAGMVCTVEVPGADHFQIVNAESECWREAREKGREEWVCSC